MGKEAAFDPLIRFLPRIHADRVCLRPHTRRRQRQKRLSPAARWLTLVWPVSAGGIVTAAFIAGPERIVTWVAWSTPYGQDVRDQILACDVVDVLGDPIVTTAADGGIEQ